MKIEKFYLPYNTNLIADSLEELKENEFSGIYVGSEFCFRLFPDIHILKKTLALITSSGLKYSIITPPLFDDELSLMKKILSELLKFSQKPLEIIINDIGLFHYLNKKNEFAPVFGRCLSHLIEDEISQSFFLNSGINTIETDSPEDFELNKSIRMNLHYPLRFIQTTRYCTIAAMKNKKIFDTDQCFRNCLETNYLIKNSYIEENILCRGNTTFIKINEKLTRIANTNISRIIISENTLEEF